MKHASAIIVLACLLAPGLSFAQTFEVLITVSDGIHEKVLTIGTHSDGSDSHDSGLDLFAPPLPFSDEIFDARLNLDGEAYFTDIRSNVFEGEVVYEMMYQAAINAGSITLTWDSTALHPYLEFFIEDVSTGTTFSLNMRTTNSLDVSTDLSLADGAVIRVIQVPDITVAPTAHDYGAVEVGSSASQVFTVSNEPTATLDLEVTVLSLKGSDASEFAIVSGGAPFTLAPGQTRQVEVTFNPASARLAPKAVTLEIISNDLDEGTIEVPLTGQGIPALSHPFVLLANKKVQIEGQIDSEGDIHSNDEIEAKKGNPSTHTGNLTAVGNIKIEDDQTIDGDATAGGNIELKGSATVTGTITEGASVGPVLLPALSFTAGGDEVNVDQGQALTLTPGTYGDVKVEKEATLSLSTGDYFIGKLELKKDAVLSFDVTAGSVTINAVNDIQFDKDIVVEIVPLGDSGSRYVTFNTLDDVDIKENAHILGTFVAPYGVMQLDKEVHFKGSICAEEIDLKKDVMFLSHEADGSLPAPNRSRGVEERAEENEEVTERETGVFLEQNFPNPFNPVTEIRFDLSESAYVRLVVYDITGREVANLVDRVLPDGRHRITWDAGNLPSGVYMYQLTAGTFTESRHMVLVK